MGKNKVLRKKVGKRLVGRRFKSDAGLDEIDVWVNKVLEGKPLSLVPMDIRDDVLIAVEEQVKACEVSLEGLSEDVVVGLGWDEEDEEDDFKFEVMDYEVVGILKTFVGGEWWVVKDSDRLISDQGYVLLKVPEGLSGEELLEALGEAGDRIHFGEEDWVRLTQFDLDRARKNGVKDRIPVESNNKAGYRRSRVSRKSVYEWFKSSVERNCVLYVLGKRGLLV